MNASAAAPIGGSIAGAITAIGTDFFFSADPPVAAPPNPGASQWCGGPWIRTTAGRFNLKSTASSSFPAPVTAGIESSTKYAGYQVGADAGICNIGGGGLNSHVGVMAGQVFAETTGASSAAGAGSTHIKFNVPYFGLYGLVSYGGFSAMVQARREAYDMDVSNTAGGLSAAPQNGQGWAVSASARYRIDLPGQWLIEPSAAISHERLRVGALTILPGPQSGVLRFAPFTSTLGRAGLRVGKTIQYGAYAIQPYAQVNVWHEFAGNLRQTFSDGGIDAPISLTRIGTFYQAGAGVAFQTQDGWVGFGQADIRFGDKVRAYSGTLAIRRQF
jgi:outer membrane autotransporter protein